MANELKPMEDLSGTLAQAKRIHEELAVAHGIAEGLRDLINEIDPEGISYQLGLARDRAKEMKETVDELNLTDDTRDAE